MVQLLVKNEDFESENPDMIAGSLQTTMRGENDKENYMNYNNNTWQFCGKLQPGSNCSKV